MEICDALTTHSSHTGMFGFGVMAPLEAGIWIRYVATG